MFSVYDLPAVNAALNACSFMLLMSGFYFIRQKKIIAHRACMIAAVVFSLLFLTSYLIYHAQVGSVKFTKTGWIRPVYFTILLTHTALAVTIVPMAAVTLFRALKERFDKHRKIARWTLPVWMYVSITGVVIYFMLYQL